MRYPMRCPLPMGCPLDIHDISWDRSWDIVVRLSSGELLVNLLQVVKRTNTPLVPQQMASSTDHVFWGRGFKSHIHHNKLFQTLPTSNLKNTRACMGTNGMGIPSNMGWDGNGIGIPQWDTRFPSHQVPSNLKFLPHSLPHNRYSTAPIPPASHPTIGTATPVPIPL